MRYEVVQLAEGWDGTDTTVEKVVDMVEAAHLDPIVVLKARDIVRRVRERDQDAEFKAISNWVRNHIRYTSERVETLRTPKDILEDIADEGLRKFGDPEKGMSTGDCDEFSTLWAALHSILNHKVRFRVVSTRGDKKASHIFGEVFIPGRGWVPDDCINKTQPMGWRVNGTTQEKLYSSAKLTDMGGLGEVVETPGTLGDFIVQAGGRIVPLDRDHAVVLVPNEELGQIVASIIGAAATVAAAGASAVMQERALKAQQKTAKVAHQEFEESLKAQQDAAAASAGSMLVPSTGSGLPKWVVPAAVLAGALALGVAFLGGSK